MMPWLEAVGLEKLEVDYLPPVGRPLWQFRGDHCFMPLGPKLEMGAKIREAVSY